MVLESYWQTVIPSAGTYIDELIGSMPCKKREARLLVVLRNQKKTQLEALVSEMVI